MDESAGARCVAAEAWCAESAREGHLLLVEALRGFDVVLASSNVLTKHKVKQQTSFVGHKKQHKLAVHATAAAQVERWRVIIDESQKVRNVEDDDRAGVHEAARGAALAAKRHTDQRFVADLGASSPS